MDKLNEKNKKFDSADIPEIEFIEYSLNEEDGDTPKVVKAAKGRKSDKDSSGIGVIDISSNKKKKYIEEIEEIEDLDDDIDDYDEDEDDEEDDGKLNIKKEIISWIVMLAIAVGIAAFISNFILINAFIPTGSMENTIPKKSRLVGLRLAYTFSDPERGDIIIFKNPSDPNENYVKRIIGLPGETVVLENSQVFVYNADGSLKMGPLDEPYLKDKVWMAADEKYEFHIPKDRYLVLGDNRNNSADARTWYRNKGDVAEIYIHEDEILAQALFIYWNSFKIFDDVEYK